MNIKKAVSKKENVEFQEEPLQFFMNDNSIITVKIFIIIILDICVYKIKHEVYPVMKNSTNIVVMKVMLWSETCLSRKIVTLVFGASVEITPQLKQKRNVCAVKKFRWFVILIFRVYLS